MKRWTCFLILAAMCAPGGVRAAETAAPGARIHNLKVLSNHVEDVTSVDNILHSFVKPGMSDQKRAQALWTAAVRYRHQTAPPNEFLAGDWEAHDPVKIFNVYGYCMCCCCSSVLEALNRADGREAQGRILNGHSVPEVKYGDAWHMFDCSLITQFPKPDGVDASVDEIGGAIEAWYKEHPEYKGNGDKLAELMRRDGWMGWKDGPPLLTACPYYKGGFFPAGTHGWNSTMSEYAKNPAPIYEYGYQTGHKALFSLRPGESLTREAGNRGLHVNMEQDPNFDQLKKKAPEEDLKYLKDFLPGYRGGVVGNGVQRYAPNLAANDLAAGAEVFENLATGKGSPALHVKAAGKPGVAVIELSSPYVYLDGTLKLKAQRKSDEDQIAVSISTNNGRDYRPLWSAGQTGPSEATVYLGPYIMRRYAYLLKVEITSKDAAGTGLDVLEVTNDIQHAPRTLPWLDKGKNTITVAADGNDTKLATRTVSCRITSEADFNKNETTGTMGVAFDNLKVDGNSCWWQGKTGTMTVPVEVPGDLVALRMSAQIRARGDKDTIKVLASTDQGKTWNELQKMVGPTPGRTHSFRFADWPSKTRNVLVKFELTGNNTVGLFSFRIDADYRDARAAASVKPFQVVHVWKQGGQEKTHVEKVAKLPATYTIDVGDEPEMVSVSYEMPATH